MEPRTRVLVGDFSLAGGAVAVGTLGVGGSLAWTTAIVAFGLAVTVCSLSLAEQTPILVVVDDYSPLSLAVAFATTLSVGLVLVVGWTVVTSPAAPLLLGAGIGLGGYRIVYGIVHPLPERRLSEIESPAGVGPRD